MYDDLIAQYHNEGVQRIKLVFADIDGIHRGKYVSLDKFASILKNGGGFCDCILGWDSNDQLYDNSKFTGWHTGFPDAYYQVDLSSERRIPDEKDTPLFVIDLVDKDGNDHPICPRSVLKRILLQAQNDNIEVKLAFEYEFFVFDETPHSIREKNYQNLTNFTPGNFGYSTLRSSVHSELYHEFMDYCQTMHFPIEGLHCETGPGVWEAALTYKNALEMADAAALFKTFAKTFFQKRNLMITFMAKWSMDYPGQSGHIHQSLFDSKSKESLFYKKGSKGNMSSTMKSYLAGQQRYLKPFLALCAPTINSYARLVKGYWAPTSSSWGIENRTTALRVIPGTEESQRIEFRVGSADANPYLAAAAIIGAGLLGIRQKLKATPAMTGNAYDQDDDLPKQYHFASNLRQATDDLKSSPEARALFGEEFTAHYIATREWEVREYERHVNDWQLKRYFEII